MQVTQFHDPLICKRRKHRNWCSYLPSENLKLASKQLPSQVNQILFMTSEVQHWNQAPKSPTANEAENTVGFQNQLFGLAPFIF